MFPELVSQVYAAAAGRIPWDRPILAVAGEFDLRAVQVIGLDKKAGSLMFDLHTPPTGPGLWVDYLRHYHALNPRLPHAASLGEGEWMHDSELFDDAFVAAHPFFTDFFVPYGGRHMSAAKVIENDDFVVLLGCVRGPDQDPLGRAEMPRLVELRHHMAEAFHNLMHYRRLQEEYLPARRVLDSIPYPVLVVDDTLGISLRNASALRLLARPGGEVFERDGALLFEEGDVATQLLAAFERLRTTTTLPAAPERAVVKVPRAGRKPLLLFASAIRPDIAMQVLGPALRWMVVAHDPEEPRPTIDPFIVAECFGLTPAESRVAVSLAKGYTVKEIAQRHRVTLNTVRSQLKSILAKTQSERQVELVGLVAGVPTFG